MIPHKTYMPYISAFVYLFCFTAKYAAVRSFSCHYFLSRSLHCVVLFSVSLKQFYFQYIANDFFVFVALRPMSTAMVIAGRSVHLTTLFPGQA